MKQSGLLPILLCSVVIALAVTSTCLVEQYSCRMKRKQKRVTFALPDEAETTESIETTETKTRDNEASKVESLYQLTILRERRVVWTISLVKAALTSLLVVGIAKGPDAGGVLNLLTRHAKDFILVIAIAFACLEIPRRVIAAHELGQYGINAGYIHGILLDRWCKSRPPSTGDDATGDDATGDDAKPIDMDTV